MEAPDEAGKLSAGLREGKVAALVWDQEVEAAEEICVAGLAGGVGFGVELS